MCIFSYFLGSNGWTHRGGEGLFCNGNDCQTLIERLLDPRSWIYAHLSTRFTTQALAFHFRWFQFQLVADSWGKECCGIGGNCCVICLLLNDILTHIPYQEIPFIILIKGVDIPWKIRKSLAKSADFMALVKTETLVILPFTWGQFLFVEKPP